jgi:hypothetical protein
MKVNVRRAASGRKHAIAMIPQSCLSLAAANQSATAFAGLAEMALSAKSGHIKELRLVIVNMKEIAQIQQ